MPMGEAIFHDLDMEGSTFEDDVMFCELNGCVKTQEGRWTHPTDLSYAEFCSHCDAQCKPAVIAGDGKISISVMEELRNNNPRDEYPWGFRQILAQTQELPKNVDDLLALYEPEAKLISEACNIPTASANVLESYLALLKDQSPMDTTQLKALFNNSNIATNEVEALLLAFKTEECPTQWRGGDYITARKEGQLAPCLSHYMNVDDTIPNFD